MTIRNVKEGKCITTLTLSGDVYKVVFDRAFRCFNIKNKGDKVIRVSFEPDTSVDDDGVIELEPKESVMLAFVKVTDTIYVEGLGKAVVSAGYMPVNTFCNATGSGGSSGSGSGDIIAPDDAELVDKGDIDDLFPDGDKGSN